MAEPRATQDTPYRALNGWLALGLALVCLLVAQALREGATFVSEDRNVRGYAITVLPCSESPPASGTPHATNTPRDA